MCDYVFRMDVYPLTGSADHNRLFIEGIVSAAEEFLIIQLDLAVGRIRDDSLPVFDAEEYDAVLGSPPSDLFAIDDPGDCIICRFVVDGAPDDHRITCFGKTGEGLKRFSFIVCGFEGGLLRLQVFVCSLDNDRSIAAIGTPAAGISGKSFPCWDWDWKTG